MIDLATPMGYVADLLRRLREQAGLTRKELAGLAGVSDTTIKLIETGESGSPRPDTLRLLARGLATHRLTRRIDRAQADELHTDLMRAAGYTPESVGVLPAEDVEIPDDIEAQVRELVGTDEGLLRAILTDLSRRPEDNRRAALRFLAGALQLSHDARPGRRARR